MMNRVFSAVFLLLAFALPAQGGTIFVDDGPVAVAAGGGSPASFVASSSNTGLDQGPLTLTEPTGTASGHVLYLLIFVDNATSITTPAGWTLLNNWAAANAVKVSLYRVVRTGSAPGLSAAITVAGNRGWEWHMSAWRDVNTTTPEAASTYSAPTTGSPTNPDCPSVTTTAVNQTVIAFGMGDDGATTLWALAGYTVISTISSGDIAIAYKQIAAAGAEDPAAFSGSQAGSGRITAGTVALTNANP